METNIKNSTQTEDVVEIDLQRFLQSIINNIWKIGLVTLLCGIFAFVGSIMLLTPKYESSALFYVNNNASIGDQTQGISNGDILSSKSLVNSYIVILKSRTTLLDVIDYADSKRTYDELLDMVSADVVDSTEIFRVTVTSTDPKEAEILANAIAHVIPDIISSIIEGSSAKVVDNAILSATPSSPNNIQNMILGFIVGFMLSAGFVILVEVYDITIKDEECIKKCCNHPILASIPDMNQSDKNGYGIYNSHNRKRKSHHSNRKKSKNTDTDVTSSVIGKDINFAASEAYKLLRTKLQYSFADEQTCRVFAVSSAMAGEGKSVSAVNLACSLAQLDKRVLLIDCDMRRPTLAEKLSLIKHPGLSEHLAGFADLDKIMQVCDANGDGSKFHVITAGTNPPNPVELMDSVKMSELLKLLRERYDYIVLDMPPVGDVSDALISAKLADGVLLVARQDYGSKVALSEAVHQFEFVNAKILGILFNCATNRATRYDNNKYRRSYRKGYIYRYGYQKGNADKRLAPRASSDSVGKK